MFNLTFKKLYKPALIASVGLIYYLLVLKGFSIPCVFYSLTGLYCPGCGITRLITNLLQGDFKNAYLSNKAIFLLLPLFAYLLVKSFYRYIKDINPLITKNMEILIWVMIIVLVLFSLYRNIALI